MNVTVNPIGPYKTEYPEVFNLPAIEFKDSDGKSRKIKDIFREIRSELNYEKPPTQRFRFAVMNDAANTIYGSIRSIFGIFEMIRFAIISNSDLGDPGTTIGDSYAPYFFRTAKLVNFSKLPFQLIDTKNFLQDIFNGKLSKRERLRALAGVLRNIQAVVADVAIVNDFLRQIGVINPEQLPMTKFLWLASAAFNVPGILIRLMDIIDGAIVFKRVWDLKKAVGEEGEKTDEYYHEVINALIGPCDDRESRAKQYSLRAFLGLPTDPVKDLKRMRETLQNGTDAAKAIEREKLDSFIKDSLIRYPKITASRIGDIILMSLEITVETLTVTAAVPAAPFVALALFSGLFLKSMFDKIILGSDLHIGAPFEWDIVSEFVKHYRKEYNIVKNGTVEQKAALFSRKIDRIQEMSDAELQQRYNFPIAFTSGNIDCNIANAQEFRTNLDLWQTALDTGNLRNAAVDMMEALFVYEAKLAMSSFEKVDNARLFVKFQTQGKKVKRAAKAIDINLAGLESSEAFLKQTDHFVRSLKGRVKVNITVEAVCLVALAVAGAGLAVLIFSNCWPAGVALICSAFGLTTAVFIARLYMKHSNIAPKELLKSLGDHELGAEVKRIGDILSSVAEDMPESDEDDFQTEGQKAVQKIVQLLVIREQADNLGDKITRRLKKLSKRAAEGDRGTNLESIAVDHANQSNMIEETLKSLINQADAYYNNIRQEISNEELDVWQQLQVMLERRGVVLECAENEDFSLQNVSSETD